MSRSRMNGGDAASTYRQQLLAAMRIFLVAPLFSGGAGLRRWTLQTLTYVAVLMAWEEGEGLGSRFEAALSSVDAMFRSRRRAGRTYQGFVKAMVRWSPRLLRRAEGRLRESVRETAGAAWETFGWVVMGVDGTKTATPRTAANEKAFGCSGRGGGGPQVWLTMIAHLATGLPWCWKIGKANASERAHLRAMMGLLPADTLLVADAGFTGYELWRALTEAGHSVLIRVGSNVRLLTKLGYAVREHDGLVYLWPDRHRRRGRAPLVLRLIRVHDGRQQMCLVTDVLDASRLSDAQAASLYRMRWGLEVGFRTLKQTMRLGKLRSGAPVNAALELRWAVVARTLLGLMGVRAISERGGDGRRLSFAGALRVIRTALRHGERRSRRGHELTRRLGAALIDHYQRRASKASRNTPRRKIERPPGCPQIRDASPTQVHAAQQLRAEHEAA